MDGSENQEVHIQKKSEYQTNECPLTKMISKRVNIRWRSPWCDDGDGDDNIENESGTRDNVDSKLSSDECSENWSSQPVCCQFCIYKMPAIYILRYILR